MIPVILTKGFTDKNIYPKRRRGMDPLSRNLSFSLCFLIITSYGLNPCFAGGSILSKGQRLYEARCLRCHGYNGKGSLETAKTLKVDPIKLDLTRQEIVLKSRKTLESYIAGGHGRMPGQKYKLTQKQIQAILQYVQTLQKAFVSK